MISNYQPNIEGVKKALEHAERLALVTVFNDTNLKDSLFELGDLYHSLHSGIEVSEGTIKETLERFEKVDPEMLRILNDDTKTS